MTYQDTGEGCSAWGRCHRLGIPCLLASSPFLDACRFPAYTPQEHVCVQAWGSWVQTYLGVRRPSLGLARTWGPGHPLGLAACQQELVGLDQGHS